MTNFDNNRAVEELLAELARRTPNSTAHDAVGAALDRLLAEPQDRHGGASRCADFSLAWWNGSDTGHCPITHIASVDPEIGEDMLTCMRYLSKYHLEYPDHWGRRDDMQHIFKLWRTAA